MLDGTVAHYKVGAQLGAGAMGVVYQATDTRLGRQVALKVLHESSIADPVRIARFEREARLLASLNHPNIGSIYGLEREGGRAVLVLEYIPGDTLADRIAHGALPLREALEIAAQVANALAAAHEVGIIHRDLKPANIKITPAGTVKVLDFGLAKAQTPASADAETFVRGDTSMQLSRPGVVMGTVAYMSPEQASGTNIDHRADIWALGCVLFEMLAGRATFAGKTNTEVIVGILDRDPDWNALPAATPDSVRSLLRRCLAKNPRARLHHAADARLELEDTLTGESPGSLPVTAATSRRRSLVSLLFLAAALIVAAVAGALWLRPRALDATRTPAPTGEDPPPIRITQLTALGNVVQANISPDGAFLSYGVNEAHQASSLWLRQIGAPSAIQLRGLSPREGWSAQFTPDGRFLYYALNDPAREARTLYRMPALGGESVEILSGIESKVTFSPDGARFAYIRDRYPTPQESSVLVANADGSGARIIATRRLPASFFVFFNAPAWSPDGTRIAVGCVRSVPGGTGRGSVIVMRPDGSQQRAIEPKGWLWAGQPEWLPDMSGLLVVAYDEFRIPTGSGQIWRLPYPEGPPVRITNDLLGYRSLSLSADGSKLVTVAEHPKSSMWRVALRTAEAPVRLTQVSNDGFFGVAATPDGELVFARYEEGRSNLYRTDASGRTRRVALPEEMWAGQPAVSPDGRLAFLLNRREIFTARIDGSDLRRLTHGAAPAFTPDGRSILFHRSSDGVPAIFSIPAKGGSETKLTEYSAQNPAVAPDGTHFAASCSYEGDIPQLCIIPITGGPPSARIPYRITSLTAWGWTADGNALFVSGGPDGGDWANIYRVPLDGTSPTRVTDLEGTGGSRFVVTEGGEAFVVIRLDLSRDAVLITGFWAPAD